MAEIPINEIVECVGLWLAEGDKTTIREVTLTNNSIDIILFFSQRIMSLYKGKNKPRIYVYSPSKRKLYGSFNRTQINFYHDFRANRPYYIFRLADTNFSKEWKTVVGEIKSSKAFYPDILRGFFAGEGNIKFDKLQMSRIVRISQGKRDEFLESIFKELGLTFEFEPERRMYWFRGKNNMDIFDRLDIVSLHPEKYFAFKEMMCSYEAGLDTTVEKAVYSLLKEPKKTKELVDMLKKNWIDIDRALKSLKQMNKIDYFRDDDNTYWARKDVVQKALLDRKTQILSRLNNPMAVGKLSDSIKISRRCVAIRLKELEKEGLIERTEKDNRETKWKKTKEGEKFMATILGLDEAGIK